jgi:hypothetical protein
MGVWVHIDDRGGVHRVVISRPGLSAILFGLLVIAAIGALAAVVLASIVVIWIPLLIAGILLALASAAARRHWDRVQTWWGSAR